MRDYGGELRAARLKAGLTLESVEELIPGCNVDKLSRIERGRQEPRCSEYDELMKFYSGVRRVAIFTYIRGDGGIPARTLIRA